jgi:hypothetical protein
MRRTPFLVGIDLGTTNCSVGALDTRRSAPIDNPPIVQLTAPATIEPRRTLPSFLYFPDEHEIDSGSVAMPWNRRPEAVAGVFARDRGALAPARQIVSAKSWLAHPGVDRRARLLPWAAEPAARRTSPVEASAAYLAHIRDAWNTTVASDDRTLRLEAQSIVLTVPASFDEEARELTVEAAEAAGLTSLTLLEEPIAAFYAWSGAHDIGAALPPGGGIALVCDVGGGTTDFSLIRVSGRPDAPAFERIAVGDHLLLGGDNVDLALAARLERKMIADEAAAGLALTQREALRRQASAAKERLLAGGNPIETVSVRILGAGQAVVGGARTASLARAEVLRVIEEFLPLTAPDDVETTSRSRAGLRELGLPYEADPAITRHLAAFLARSAAVLSDGDRAAVRIGNHAVVRPDAVLFNGGFFTPALARQRIVDALTSWFGAPPRVLAATDLQAAVAIGATRYAQLRAGSAGAAPLVKAGSGRAYFAGLRGLAADGDIAAVCVLARGTEEGTRIALDHPFTVATNMPIAFSLYSSTTRRDEVGSLVRLSPAEVHEHAPLVTVLRYGRRSRQVELPVRLAVAFTELGTLELWCESEVSEHRWRMQFQLRSGAEHAASSAPVFDSGPEAVVGAEAIADAEQAIESVFGGAEGEGGADQLVARLEQTLGYARPAWPIGPIRQLADRLLAVADARRQAPRLEARWLNLFGFCLRPGFGAAKDPWRIAEARKIYLAGLAFPAAIQNRAEWLVLWQRVSGGFSTGQQQELAQRVGRELGLGARKAPRVHPQLERESWRLLASLERLDAANRVAVGDALIVRLQRDPGNASLLWAIGRAGARVPLYGPLSSVVPAADAARWVQQLAALKPATPDLAIALVQMAALTGDPLRDLDDRARAAARAAVELAVGIGEAVRPLFEVISTSAADANRVFGEPLPDGLRLERAADAVR